MIIILCICTLQQTYSQEEEIDGVVALALPVRNSLTFNRYAINPTFSFVREQNKYISIYSKREWVQFDDAPLTYLASYSGRFAENIGAGLGLFQQNNGILTTFGGVLNFAYNVNVTRDSNLTFGLNIGAYKSGVNTSNVVLNFDDPSLQNVPENFLLTISPGINYGFDFIDIGISINNLVAYNLESSAMIEDNPEQSLQAHLLYTGYMDSRGFFDESKFSGLIKSEFRKDETIISGLAMLTIPKGIWGQVGYNTRYGISGGIGLNITKAIALEYNFETDFFGDLNEFGPSHEITFAYRFKNNNRYDYGSDDEIVGLISTDKKPKAKSTISKSVTQSEQKAKEEAEAQAKLLAEQKAKEEAEAQAKLLAEQKAKEEAEAQAKLLAEQKAKEEAEAQAKLLAEQKAKEEAEAQAKLLAEQKAKEEAEAQAKLLAEQKAKEEAEAQAKLLAEQKAKEEAEAQAKLLAEQKAKEEAEAQAKLLAEQKAKEELITNPKNKIGKDMLALTQQTETDKISQNELLKKFDEIINVKNQDLKDLKEENDLSEQGITVAPKPFKSISEENNKLNKIKSDLDSTIAARNKKIKDLQELYDDTFVTDTLYNEEVILFYKKKLNELKSEQAEALATKTNLEVRLEQIRIDTEFERKRRIKRAAFDNEEERYTQDRAALEYIKKTTIVTNELTSPEDFDTGEKQDNNIQILKNVKNVDEGYYLVIAVHTDKLKRDEFLTKVISSGELNVDFFYDVSTSKYYIYSKKLSTIDEANNAIKNKSNKPYNNNMSLVKIEN
ncbi:PorP/SprF family type IX secretion system membrane protein [Pontimicrobium sp. IMCC45349]|uniref:PorP/SprF family type IX secretion system membrane protein n=1 Tax=Pontimicrobium sp. IMCC45349 TaxID=3391574 RepID=UPI0039A03CA3